MVYKPLPGCLINQGPLYQLLTLQRQHHFVAEDVKSITVTLSPRNADYPGTKNYGPFDSPTGAIMSCAFMLATGLRDGTLKITDFDQHYGVGTIHDLSRCVIVQAAEGMSDWGSKVVVFRCNCRRKGSFQEYFLYFARFLLELQSQFCSRRIF